mgnify:CR=1 FL=1
MSNPALIGNHSKDLEFLQCGLIHYMQGSQLIEKQISKNYPCIKHDFIRPQIELNISQPTFPNSNALCKARAAAVIESSFMIQVIRISDVVIISIFISSSDKALNILAA